MANRIATILQTRCNCSDRGEHRDERLAGGHEPHQGGWRRENPHYCYSVSFGTRLKFLAAFTNRLLL